MNDGNKLYLNIFLQVAHLFIMYSKLKRYLKKYLSETQTGYKRF